MTTKEFFNSVANSWDLWEKATKKDLVPYVNLTLVENGDEVLDLACGTGVISGILYEKGATVTGLDIAENMIEIAKKKYIDKDIEFICGDYYFYNEKKFDKIVVFNAYPHFLDKQAFINKSYELLKENGTITILHNIGREKLQSCHSGVMDISCDLLEVNEEAKFFKDKFDVITAMEAKDLYLIQGRKKNNEVK